MKFYKTAAAASFALLLSGCSSFGIDGPFLNSRTIQAEERMLLVTDKATAKDSDIKIKRVVCAEPSPDAISAIAFSGGLKADVNGEGGSINGAFSQSIGELGERTPVIQLLRDNLYRACEAHMNGVINEIQYKDILAFFDIYSATLLGIESVTHSSRAPVVVQNTATSKVNSDKSIEATTASNNPTPPVTTSVLPSKDIATTVKDILTNYYNAKMELIKLLDKLESNKKPK